MLEILKTVKNKEDLISNIFKRFFSYLDGDYIPAIIKDGDLYSEDESSEFYSKLIILREDEEIEGTWICSNLTGVDVSREEREKGYNLITNRNYNHQEIYQFNPSLYNSNLVWESTQKNTKVVNQFLENHNGLEEISVLKHVLNNPEILLLNKKAIEHLVSFSKKSHFQEPFIVCIEFEYRYKNDTNRIEDYSGPLSNSEITGYIDIFNSKNRRERSITDYELTTIKGTAAIDFTDSEDMLLDEKSSIKVVNFDDSMIRDLDTSNYNDDIDAGLVVFSKEVKDVLDKEYYYSGTNLLPKREHQESILVDVLSENIVFWEGEFNNFPIEIKKEMEKYNLIDKTSGIISDMMFAWQLEGDWNFLDKGLPNQKLGSFTYGNYRLKAAANNLSFWETENVNELRTFLKKIFVVYNISPNDFSNQSDEVKKLQEIFDNEAPVELDSTECKLLMQKFCFAILNKVEAID